MTTLASNDVTRRHVECGETVTRWPLEGGNYLCSPCHRVIPPTATTVAAAFDPSWRQDAHRAAHELGELGWIILDTWDDHDPWGSTMGARFTINDALGIIGGETDPTYSPGMDPLGELEQDHGGPDLLAALEDGTLAVESAERADRILDALTDELVAAGRDY